MSFEEQNEETLRRLKRDIGEELAMEIRDMIVRKDKVHTWYLEKSVKFDGVDTITVDAPYAQAVEFGVGPGHYPPIDKLVQWVKDKIGEDDAYGIARKIQNKIYHRGIKPSFFMKNSILKFINKYGVKRIRMEPTESSKNYSRNLSVIKKNTRKAVRFLNGIKRMI